MVGIWVSRRARAGQPEVIEIGAAERCHKKVIGQRVAPRDLPQRKLRGVSLVVGHGQSAGIRECDELVVLASIYLHLVLVEQMPEVTGGDIERRVEAFRVVDSKGCIGKMLGLRLGDRWRDSLCGQSAPHGRQLLQDRPVAIPLQRFDTGDVLKSVRPWKKTIEIVEAAIFGINYDNVPDLLEPDISRRCSPGGTRR